jgi:hypothetical protein
MSVSCWFEIKLKAALPRCGEFLHIGGEISICAFLFYIVKFRETEYCSNPGHFFAAFRAVACRLT